MAIERKTGLPNTLDTPELDNLADLMEIEVEDATTEETEDGGMVVDFGPPLPVSTDPMDFTGNLADVLDESRLTSIGHEIIRLADDDDRTREEWHKTYSVRLSYFRPSSFRPFE